jgi:hypothetical protein
MSAPYRRVEYQPPSPELLEHFAREVCLGLGPDYCQREVVEGFASFMKVISRALANSLNRKGDNPVDNGFEWG